MKHIGKFVMRYPKGIIAAVLLSTLFFAYFIPQIQFNNDPGDFIPPDDPDRIFDEQIQETFGNDDIIYIGLVVDNVYAPQHLAKIALLTELIEELEGVVDVKSLASVKNIEGTIDGMEVYPFVDDDALPETLEEGQAIRKQVENWDLLVRNLVSEDGTATTITVKMEPNIVVAEQEKVFDRVMSVINEHKAPGESYHFSGGSTIYVLLGQYMRADIRRLLPIAFLIVALILYLSLRSINGVALPLLNVGIAVIWTVGCMAMLGVELSLPCTAIPVILVAVGSAYAIHVIHGYYDELAKGLVKDEAFLHCFDKIGVAVIMAGLTTVAGFGTLATSEVRGMQDFGIFTAFGTFVALLLALTFLPAVLYLEKVSQKQLQQARGSSQEGRVSVWAQKFRKAEVAVAMKHRGITVIVVLVLLVLAVWGTTQVYVDDNGIDYFNKRTQMRYDDAVLTKHFGGTHLYSVIITGPEADSLKEPIILKNMEALQAHVEEKFPFIGKTISLADYIKKMNMAMHENQEEFYTLPDPDDPDARNLIAQYLLLYSMSGEPDDFDDVVDYAYQQARLLILAKNGSTVKTQQVVQEIYDFVEKHFDKRYTVRVTGSAYMPVVMDRYMVRGLVRSVTSSLIAVWILTSIIFRSISGGLIAIIPLSMAVLGNFAVMGFLKIPLEMGTAVVSNAAIGIGVDYAIHFLTRFRYEMKARGLAPNNNGFFRAAFLTATSSGQAILYNAIAVAAGFLVLLYSSFMPLVRLGGLVAMVMIVTSAASVMILPVILSLVKPGFITQYARVPGRAPVRAVSES